MNNKNKQKAFTLVELIVVITILAILWTIAFLSLQSYSKSARNSTRISNLSKIKSTLELFYINAWKYPLTTWWFNVFYSWSLTWSQWVFWNDTFNNVDKLDKIPVDPLTWKEYTYSTSNTKQEYQLSWIFEWWLTSYWLWITDEVLAWDIVSFAIVTGNYNWVLFKTLTWAHCEILSVPSIVSSMSETTTDLIDIINNKWLVYNWYNNLPSNYINSKYKNDWWFNFDTSSIVAYSDNENCDPLFSTTDNTARKTMLEWLKNSYSWTIIELDENIANIINLDINDNNQVATIWNSIINNSLWWNLEINNASLDSSSWSTVQDLIQILFVNADNESYTCDLCD